MSSTLLHAVRRVESPLNGLWTGSLLLIVVCTALIGWVVDPQYSRTDLFLNTLLGAASMSTAMGAGVVFMSSRSVPRLRDVLWALPATDDPSAEAPLSPDEARVLQVVRGTRARMVISWAMVDALALAGVFLAYSTDTWRAAWPFAFSSLALTLMMRPRLSSVAEELARKPTPPAPPTDAEAEPTPEASPPDVTDEAAPPSATDGL